MRRTSRDGTTVEFRRGSRSRIALGTVLVAPGVEGRSIEHELHGLVCTPGPISIVVPYEPKKVSSSISDVFNPTIILNLRDFVDFGTLGFIIN